jgi:hypothetical protein
MGSNPRFSTQFCTAILAGVRRAGNIRFRAPIEPCGTQENEGGGALARCFRLHMVPLCVQYLQNTTLWDYSSS